MKTLAEVIDELEDEGLFADALHYLKMYRSDMRMYAENQKHWEDELKQKIKDFGDAKDRYVKRLKELDIGTLNNPLTWEELKQMEGKPVWVEVSEAGFWGYVLETECAEREIMPRIQILDCSIDRRMNLHKDEIGKTWQAYRKERE